MIRSIIALCADGVVRDCETNHVSIFNIMEQIAVPGFPVFLPRFSVFNLLTREANDPSVHECELVISNNDAVIVTTPIRVDFQDKMRNRCTVVIGGLTIANPGRVTATLRSGGAQLSSYCIEVILTRPPEAQPVQ